MWFDTRSTFLTVGTARGPTALNAFDNALRDAKISDFNLIKVSSILPPGRPLRILGLATPVVDGRGMMLPAVLSSIESAETGATISAGIAVGRPADSERAGVVYKHSGLVLAQDVQDVLEEMVDEALRVQRGVSDYDFLPLIAEAVVDSDFTGVVACLGYCDTVLERVVFGSERVVERATGA